jgi:SAM-dependent methyltransferase
MPGNISSSENSRFFPDWDWEELYSYGPRVKRLPWFTEHLDADLKNELNIRKISSGKFLDIGTGVGSHAIELSKLGFEVTATDISQNAIDRARALSKDVTFFVDDIIHSRLSEEGYVFDYAFDRGCFHTLDPKYRSQYVTQVKKLIVSEGLFFLKTFSTKQPQGPGPHRFSTDMIAKYFGDHFKILKSIETVYEGTLRVLPKALFTVMAKM